MPLTTRLEEEKIAGIASGIATKFEACLSISPFATGGQENQNWVKDLISSIIDISETNQEATFHELNEEQLRLLQTVVKYNFEKLKNYLGLPDFFANIATWLKSNDIRGKEGIVYDPLVGECMHLFSELRGVDNITHDKTKEIASKLLLKLQAGEDYQRQVTQPKIAKLETIAEKQTETARQMQDLQNAIIGLKKQLTNREENIAVLNNKLEAKEAKIVELQLDIEAQEENEQNADERHEGQLSDWRSKLSDSKRESQKLQQKLTDTQESLAESQNQQQELKGNLQQLKDKNQSDLIKIAQKLSELMQHSHEAIIAKEQYIIELSEQMISLSASHAADLNLMDDINEEQKALSKVSAALADDRIAELEAELNKAKEANLELAEALETSELQLKALQESIQKNKQKAYSDDVDASSTTEYEDLTKVQEDLDKFSAELKATRQEIDQQLQQLGLDPEECSSLPESREQESNDKEFPFSLAVVGKPTIWHALEEEKSAYDPADNLSNLSDKYRDSESSENSYVLNDHGIAKFDNGGESDNLMLFYATRRLYSEAKPYDYDTTELAQYLFRSFDKYSDHSDQSLQYRSSYSADDVARSIGDSSHSNNELKRYRLSKLASWDITSWDDKPSSADNNAIFALGNNKVGAVASVVNNEPENNKPNSYTITFNAANLDFAAMNDNERDLEADEADAKKLTTAAIPLLTRKLSQALGATEADCFLTNDATGAELTAEEYTDSDCRQLLMTMYSCYSAHVKPRVSPEIFEKLEAYVERLQSDTSTANDDNTKQMVKLMDALRDAEDRQTAVDAIQEFREVMTAGTVFAADANRRAAKKQRPN